MPVGNGYCNDPAKKREYNSAWVRANKEHRAAYFRARRKDPEVRLLHNLRVRLHDAMTGRKKSAPTMKLVGCSVEELRIYLEKQFSPGMSWENYGAWHVDHIRACATFDLTDREQQAACFHFSNLQPLWAYNNSTKGHK